MTNEKHAVQQGKKRVLNAIEIDVDTHWAIFL